MIENSSEGSYDKIILSDGQVYSVAEWEIANKLRLNSFTMPKDARLYTLGDLKSQSGSGSSISIDGVIFNTPSGSWKTNQEGIDKLQLANRIEIVQ